MGPYIIWSDMELVKPVMGDYYNIVSAIKTILAW